MRGSIRLPASGRVSDPLGPSPASVTYALTWERNRGTLPEPFWHVRLGDVLYSQDYIWRDVTPRGIMFKVATSSEMPIVYEGSPPNGTGFAVGWRGWNDYSYLQSITGGTTINNSIFNVTTLSVSFWFRLNALPSVGSLYHLVNRYYPISGSNRWYIGVHNTSGTISLKLVTYDGGTTQTGVASVDIALSVGEWWFVTGVVNGTALSIRGTKAGATSLGAQGTATATSLLVGTNEAYHIGGGHCTGCQHTPDGQIAEVSFFRNYALTQQDEEDLAGVNASGGAQVNRLFAA